MTRHYWMFTTGAGMGVLISAALGLVVGIVVVAQTIYATTMDHIHEFGTLKAMGAPNRYIYQGHHRPGRISAVLGYVVCHGGQLSSWFAAGSGAEPTIVVPLAARRRACFV